jgi:radical SAM superfamily enzyme YgiQ (UPF0313 family)
MRNPGEILLVSCYELGHQPLHLATLQSLLTQAGYAPTPVDTAVETLNDETILVAQFVAISVPMHTALRLGEQIARRVRALNPQAYICLYGLYALLNADYLLSDTIDAAIGGEYEEPLLNLVAARVEGAATTLPGVKTREQESGPWIQRAPLTLPQREQLPELKEYARLELNGVAWLAGYTETTRGCKHTCLHCPITPIYQGRFFAIPAEAVLTDIRAQVAQGARHITFGDPDFFNGPTHALRIARALHQEFPEVTFDATIKIEHLLKQKHLLPELHDLGCVFVVSAVESLNDTVLAHLVKNHTQEDVIAAFALMESVGIPLRPSLLPFSPWETLESYLELLNFFEREHLVEHIDPVHLSIRLLIPPGSALLDAPEERSWLGELDSAAYTYRWKHPDRRMDTLQSLIAVLVDQAQTSEEDPVLTFFRVKELAHKARGQEFSAYKAREAYGAGKTLPHLSESWFCCAEPTTVQLNAPHLISLGTGGRKAKQA